MTSLRVAVAGGGLGGLCLAQGLLRAGDPGVDPYAPATLSTSVSRQTFREVLAAGLEDRIVFGRELTRYEAEAGSGAVRLHFADGRHADADLLVGADGVGSAVRRQYLPAAEPADTGVRSIYGKTPLGEQALARLPAAMTEGFTAVVGGRIGMATGLVRFRHPPQELGFSPAEDYLMWAVTGDRGEFGVPDDQLAGMEPARLPRPPAEHPHHTGALNWPAQMWWNPGSTT